MSTTTAPDSARDTPRGRPAIGGWIHLPVIWFALLSAPLWMGYVGGYDALASRILVFGLAAMGLNLLLGFTGVMSFGHAAYFGLGAYGAGFVLRYWVHSTPLAILCGILLGTLAGIVFGALMMRRTGIYFAMLTIAFSQICYYFAYSWNSVTGGYDGLRGFERAPLHFGPWVVNIQTNGLLFYYFVLAVFAICTALMGLLLRSPLGRTMVAIRENPQRARFLGIPVEQHVWIAFIISTFFTAIAGALYALLNNFADPTALYWVISGNIVIMAVLGGMLNFWGPLVGAAVFVWLEDYISSMTVNWMSFIGLIFVVVVLFFPRGLLGFMRRRSS
ncbi:MAG: branched-chain amino acid ABC transporter permease [Proteobacteria bacterium]|nr:branched-chain amino acid ABC transporter permease [Pseudomonadota bacterium]